MVKLDCLNAYNQLELHPDDHHLTAFLYHGKQYSNRYQYRAAPMGLSSSSDSFLAAINHILEPCKSYMLQEVDDLLVTTSTLEELNRRLRKVLTLCSDNGVQLSRA